MLDRLFHYRIADFQVLDGDTIKAEVDLGFHTSVVETFRLARIQAPEKGTVEGEQAANALVVMLLDGKLKKKPVVIASAKQEKWRRWLAEVWVGDVNVNDWLVEKGWAKPYGP